MAAAGAFAAPWLLIRTSEVALPPPVSVGDSAQAWQLPPKPWPRFVDFPVAKWVGKPIREAQIAPWVDTSALPSDNNRWVIYRHSCEHCRDYLRQLHAATPVDPELVLIEILDDLPRAVDLMPDTPWKAELPKEVEWVFTPPWELILGGGVIKSATFRGPE